MSDCVPKRVQEKPGNTFNFRVVAAARPKMILALLAERPSRLGHVCRGAALHNSKVMSQEASCELPGVPD